MQKSWPSVRKVKSKNLLICMKLCVPSVGGIKEICPEVLKGRCLKRSGCTDSGSFVLGKPPWLLRVKKLNSCRLVRLQWKNAVQCAKPLSLYKSRSCALTVTLRAFMVKDLREGLVSQSYIQWERQGWDFMMYPVLWYFLEISQMVSSVWLC